jgi:PAS domain-containing protein
MSSKSRSHDPLGDSAKRSGKSLERYAALVERAGYGVIGLIGGRFIEVNSVLVAMLGYSSAGRAPSPRFCA